jgi:hypothetical protein
MTIATASRVVRYAVADSRVEQQHRHADPDDRQQCPDHGVHAAVEELRDRVDVGGLPRDDPPRGVVLVERHRQPLEVLEDPGPQVEHDVLPDPPGEQHERALGEHLQACRDGERDADDGQRAAALPAQQRRDAAVDAGADEVRAGERGEVLDDDEAEDDPERAAVRGEQAAEQAPAAAAEQAGHRRGDVLGVLGRDAAPVGAGPVRLRRRRLRALRAGIVRGGAHRRTSSRRDCPGTTTVAGSPMTSA